MREVVLNGCYGGFCLSPKALIELYSKKNGSSKFFVYQEVKIEDPNRDLRLPIPFDLISEPYNYLDIKRRIYVAKSNIGQRFYEPVCYHSLQALTNEEEDFIKLTEKVYKKLDIIKLDTSYFKDLLRHDEDLVSVVKDLGSDANGLCSELIIKKIPDNERYRISEYDGLESIETYTEMLKYNWQ